MVMKTKSRNMVGFERYSILKDMNETNKKIISSGKNLFRVFAFIWAPFVGNLNHFAQAFSVILLIVKIDPFILFATFTDAL